jgi:hypothetical protein
MSEQERERAGSQDVEAHRFTAAQNEEPKDEERTESAEDEEVEGHVLSRRARHRARH